MRWQSFVLIFLFWISQQVHAIPCEGWMRHLQKDHDVWLLNKSAYTNSAFNYQSIPNTNFIVATSKESKPWTVEANNKESSVLVKNKYFGYAIEYDKNGKCVNSYGTSYDPFNNSVIEFNYDWNTCEKIDSIFKNKISTGDKPEIQTIIKKLTSAEKRKLSDAVKKANSLPFKPKVEISSDEIISRCLGQNKFLEHSLRGVSEAPSGFNSSIQNR